jgi:hypothetical protein
VFINNLDKIIGLVGLVIGIELIAAAIFTLSIVYFKNPATAGVIGNMSSLSIFLGMIANSIRIRYKLSN